MQPEQVAKVRGDLGVTQQNMAVFSEMLSELKPGLEHPEVCIIAMYSTLNWCLKDRSMFEALHATCRAMQSRLVELIDQVCFFKINYFLCFISHPTPGGR